MASNKNNQNDELVSFDHIKYLANLLNFGDVKMDVVLYDEIHEVVMEEDGSDQAKNLLANPSKTPAAKNNRRTKKYYRRIHFPTKEMEAYYKACTHPNEKQRKELAKELGLHPLQVAFWFKNKRKQMKIHQEYLENIRLRIENKILKSMKFRNHSCPCGCKSCDEHALKMMQLEDYELRMENKRLKKEYATLLLNLQNRNFGVHQKTELSFL